jgi:putative transposase
MCRCLRVSPSGYYAWRKRKPSPRTQENARLLTRIQELHKASDGVLGAPRMWEELEAEGETCSPNRVARLMRLHGLQGVPVRRAWRKKPSGKQPVGVENHLARDFVAQRSNAKWVTDITYIPTTEGWLYLSAVQDLYSKEIVGWSMGVRQTRQLVLQAVLMALWQREEKTPVVLHSDRGTQFTSGEYQRFLKGHNLTCSMSAKGTCADNAPAESFFGLLKRDRVNRRRYATRAEARTDVFDYIERFHNPRMRRRTERQAQEKTT